MSIDPNGRLRFSAAIFDAMVAMERLYSSNLSGSQLMEISRCGAPEMETVPTPRIRLMGCATRSSRILYKAFVLGPDFTDNIRIGMSSMLNLKRNGRLQPSGKAEFIMSNLSRTSFVALSMSMPYSNSNVTME